MNTTFRRLELQPGYSISSVIKGGWHLAGGHGTVDEEQAVEDMRAFVQAGITTFDCADIYTGVETLIGKFIKRYSDAFKSGDLPPIQIHTKYVPDFDALATITKRDTEAIIDRSLLRLGVERLDLVQFAWWDYSVPRYVETAHHLVDLRKAGKIRYIGATNFDAVRLQEIVDSGVPVVAHQVQYSVLDQRPEGAMRPLLEKHEIKLLCYGTIAGGFLSDRYLGAAEPEEPLENRSLVKYKLIIDEFGGFDLFQELLAALKRVARKYDAGIAEVAAQFVLQMPFVAGVIIGARNTKHLQALSRLQAMRLTDEDLQSIRAVIARGQGPKGPVYGLERDKTGKHGRIMRYNLNK